MSKEIPALKKQARTRANCSPNSRKWPIRSRRWTRAERSGRQNLPLRGGAANLPAEDVVAGGKENNQVVKVYGEKPVFDWEPKNHVDLCTDLA